MLITNGSRQCVLKLKDYSDKKANSSARLRSLAKSYRKKDNLNTNPAFTTPLVSTNNNNNDIPIDASTDTIEDNSFLGRLLNCKPCRRVTEAHKNNSVCFNNKIKISFRSSFL
jgi:hypothetical protein